MRDDDRTAGGGGRRIDGIELGQAVRAQAVIRHFEVGQKHGRNHGRAVVARNEHGACRGKFKLQQRLIDGGASAGGERGVRQALDTGHGRCRLIFEA